MSDVHLSKFPTSFKQAIAFEYMKRNTDKSSSPEQMTAIYEDALKRVINEHKSINKSSGKKDSGVRLYDL